MSQGGRLKQFMSDTFNCDHLHTDFTTDYNTTIDLIFSNYADPQVGCINTAWSDHKLMWISLAT